MDKGQIVEWGTHSELLSRTGIYAKLWRVQSGMAWAEPVVIGE